MTEDDAKMLAAALVDEFLRRVSVPVTTKPPPIEPRFMKITDYAKRSGFCRSTVQEYVRAGMPAIRTGKRGHKIDVRAADEWLRQGGAASVELHS